jgi:hypothetical protein
MKVTILLSLIIFFTSCDQSISENKIDSPTPTNFELAKKAKNETQTLKDLLKAKEAENIQEYEQKYQQQLKKHIIELSKTCQLPILEKSITSKEDLEVRVWRNSAWWKTWTFIIKRSSQRWSSNFQTQIFEDGTLKLKKISKRRLIEPKSGWENFWQQLTNEEILALTDGFKKGGDDPCPDCGAILIETNIGGDYRFYQYTDFSSQGKLRETRQIAKILEIIAEEFNLPDFKTSEPLPIE